MIEVTVYTKPRCVQCNATYLSLDKKGISFNTVDISIDPDKLEEMKALGHMSAPVVTLHKDGVLVDSWAGFRPDKIDELAAA